MKQICIENAALHSLFSFILHLTLEPGECLEGSVRLADGDIIQEGRLEVCLGGVWGSVCGDGWDQTDAYTLCQQLDLGEGGEDNSHRYTTRPIIIGDSCFVHTVQNQPCTLNQSLEKEKVQLCCPMWSVVDGRPTFSSAPARNIYHLAAPAVTLREFFVEIVRNCTIECRTIIVIK